jgi:hypothetical protein
MVNVPDEIRIGELARKAARALVKAGFEHRIDIFRDVEVEDPVVQKMLGQAHRVRVRIKITAESLLFSPQAEEVVASNIVTLSAKPQSIRKAGAQAAARVPIAAGAKLRRTGS